MSKTDATFWRPFAVKNWEKSPAYYPQLFAGSTSPESLALLDASAVFQMLVLYADLCRRRQNPAGYKLFIDGQLQYEEETLDLLPQKSDGSLQGYHQRMNEMFADYCLVCDELLQVCGPHWQNLRQFLNGLYQQIGQPSRFAEMGLYLGNYKKTPFGIHVDACGVFSFPVLGTKRFRLWEPAYLNSRPRLQRAHHYAKHLEESTLLTLRPGDLSYWPSHAWHIAESDGSLSATWSLGIWTDFEQERKNPSPVKLTTPQLKEIALFLPRQTQLELLRDLSTSGLKGRPPRNLRDRKVPTKNTPRAWQLKSNLEIPWLELDARTLAIGILGRCHFAKNSAGHIRFLENINSGQRMSLKEWPTGSFERRILNQLIRSHHLNPL